MKPEISIEFFPPQTPEGMEKLRATWTRLAELKPEFFSVTYGAGGSTREKTLHTVRAIAAAMGEALAGSPDLVWIETPSNPLLRITDIRRVADASHAVGALVVFPRFWVEDLGDESGQLDITITLNGVAYTPPSGAPAED